MYKVLEKGGPYPQVILPQFGGYWIEDAEAPAGTPSSSESSFCEEEEGDKGMSPGGAHSYRLECNSTARAYRKHFLGKVSVFTWCVCFCLFLSLTLNVSFYFHSSRSIWTTTALAAALVTSSCLWNMRRLRARSSCASCSGLLSRVRQTQTWPHMDIRKVTIKTWVAKTKSKIAVTINVHPCSEHDNWKNKWGIKLHFGL